MANVYVRPVPEPSLSARRLAVRLPVICASDEEMDSLLVIPVILHTGLGSQLSDAETETVTGTTVLFGGQSTFGEAETEEIVGGCLSTTVTFALQVEVSFSVSVAVRVTAVVPSGYGPAGVWLTVTVSPSGSEEPLSTDAADVVHIPGSVGVVTFWHLAIGGPPPTLVDASPAVFKASRFPTKSRALLKKEYL
jgi:hypothetical protein